MAAAFVDRVLILDLHIGSALFVGLPDREKYRGGFVAVTGIDGDAERVGPVAAIERRQPGGLFDGIGLSRDLATQNVAEVGDTVSRSAEVAGDEYDEPAYVCLLYTSPSPRDATLSRMPSSA